MQPRSQGLSSPHPRGSESLRGEISKTPKKIYAASSNATSSCKLCKSVGEFLALKICLEKQIVYSYLLLKRFTFLPFLQRSELFLHLRCRPCKRRLKNFIAFKVPMKRNHFISLCERALKMMKNGVYFTVLVHELFKILIYAN